MPFPQPSLEQYVSDDEDNWAVCSPAKTSAILAQLEETLVPIERFISTPAPTIELQQTKTAELANQLNITIDLIDAFVLVKDMLHVSIYSRQLHRMEVVRSTWRSCSNHHHSRSATRSPSGYTRKEDGTPATTCICLKSASE